MKQIQKLILTSAMWLGLLCFFGLPLHAQFQGGDDDGYASAAFHGLLVDVNTDHMFRGGSRDGFAHLRYGGSLNGSGHKAPYRGGKGDGYGQASFMGSLTGFPTSTMYAGGVGDGFSHARTSGFLQGTSFPVALLTFEAFSEQEYVLIRWITASEENTDVFTVERSEDARAFVDLLHTPAAGHSRELLHYEETDPAPLPGRSFYRLRSTDFDGTFTHSQIVEVNRERIVSWRATVFPNPSSGTQLQLRLEGVEPGIPFEANLMDAQGKIIHRESFLVGTAPHRLDWGRPLPTGSYLLRISGEAGQLSKLILIR